MLELDDLFRDSRTWSSTERADYGKLMDYVESTDLPLTNLISDDLF